MSPKETIVVFNNTRKFIHSVHVENANAIKERVRMDGLYPNISYLVLTLEEAEQNIRNSLRQELLRENLNWGC